MRTGNSPCRHRSITASKRRFLPALHYRRGTPSRQSNSTSQRWDTLSGRRLWTSRTTVRLTRKGPVKRIQPPDILEMHNAASAEYDRSAALVFPWSATSNAGGLSLPQVHETWITWAAQRAAVPVEPRGPSKPSKGPEQTLSRPGPRLCAPARGARHSPRNGGTTAFPLTETCAVSTKLGSVLDACASSPSTIATKAKMPTQVPMMPLLPMFTVSFRAQSET